ncbi:MAG: hypothetical protein RL154_783 [Pseudomonadota bacterium]|jgi:hypothetical protein
MIKKAASGVGALPKSQSFGFAKERSINQIEKACVK